MLKYEVPAVYEIIMRMSPKGMYCAPTMRNIRVVCSASSDPSLKKPKFLRYLDEYQKKGLCCNRPKILTPQREKYYALLREKRLNLYIQTNKAKVQKMRKQMRQKSEKSHCDDD